MILKWAPLSWNSWLSKKKYSPHVGDSTLMLGRHQKTTAFDWLPVLCDPLSKLNLYLSCSFLITCEVTQEFPKSRSHRSYFSQKQKTKPQKLKGPYSQVYSQQMPTIPLHVGPISTFHRVEITAPPWMGGCIK